MTLKPQAQRIAQFGERILGGHAQIEVAPDLMRHFEQPQAELKLFGVRVVAQQAFVDERLGQAMQCGFRQRGRALQIRETHGRALRRYDVQERQRFVEHTQAGRTGGFRRGLIFEHGGKRDSDGQTPVFVGSGCYQTTGSTGMRARLASVK